MTPAFDDLADTRPRIRRDVLFTQTPSGVLFHNSQGGFEVGAKSAYRFVSLVVPHLNGEHRLGDIGSVLTDGQRTMLADVVDKLLERGFARDARLLSDRAAVLAAPVATEFAPQIDYIEHFQDDAAERFARFRELAVVVLGGDEVAGWCALTLVRNGVAKVTLAGVAESDQPMLAETRAEVERLTAKNCPAEVVFLRCGDHRQGLESPGEFDVVVCAGLDAPQQVFTLLSHDVPERRVVLPVTTFGQQAIIGPASSVGRSSCWVCAVLRLGANGDGATAAELWASVAHPELAVSQAPLRGSLAAMIGNQLGYEIFRLVTDALPGETDGRMIVQDVNSLDSTNVRVLPHPRCPFCSGGDRAGDSLCEPVDLAGVELVAPTTASPETADDTGELLAELNGRNVLVDQIAGVFTAYDDDTLSQTPLKVSTIRLGLGPARQRRVAAFDIHHTAGARLRALRAAASVYVDHAVPLSGVRSGAGPMSDLARFGLDRLSTASGIVAPVDHWAAAASLTTGEQVWVPAAAIRPFGQYNATKIVTPSSAGTGAGTSLSEALHNALFSALAYATVLDAVRGRRHVSMIPLSTVESDAELRFLARSITNLRIDADLLDLGDGVLVARAGDGLWAVGADGTWRRAAVSALRDLLGQAQLGRELPGDAPVDLGDPLIPAFDPGTLVVAAESAPSWDSADSGRAVLDRLRARGRDALAVHETPDDLRAGGLVTARVVLTS
jgi:bacteriocin biosynthesis cyclodehydratase domain-containing protein